MKSDNPCDFYEEDGWYDEPRGDKPGRDRQQRPTAHANPPVDLAVVESAIDSS
jgi:hypothetical protein